MGRIRNTITLAKQSWRVLQADRELLALPVMSAIASLITMALFIVPLFATGFLFSAAETGGEVALSLVTFAMYLVLAFVTVFFNAALVHAANERMSGGDPTIGSALGGASRHLGSIMLWALISATVSTILRSIEERAGFVGAIVASIVGVAWALATFFVIPILVIDGLSPVDAIKRSGALFKQTWGEQIAANFGFGVLGFLAALPAFAFIALGIMSGTNTGAGVGIVIGVVWLIMVAVVFSALNGVFQTALYRFAAGPTVGGAGPAAPGATPGGWSVATSQPPPARGPAFFDEATLRNAYRPK